jgi:hypothetical protein
MPEAVGFHHSGKIHTVYFAHPKAMLPVRLQNGEVHLVKWGRRQHENSEMPLGGWARLNAIHEGKWSHYLPKPVCLPVTKFMQTDYEGYSQWYDIVKGQSIQGLVARQDDEYRVYIVTIIPERLDLYHDRWPRIVVHKR